MFEDVDLTKNGDCSLEMPEHQGNINIVIELNPLV